MCAGVYVDLAGRIYSLENLNIVMAPPPSVGRRSSSGSSFSGFRSSSIFLSQHLAFPASGRDNADKAATVMDILTGLSGNTSAPREFSLHILCFRKNVGGKNLRFFQEM